jgi:hypothetical protein
LQGSNETSLKRAQCFVKTQIEERKKNRSRFSYQHLPTLIALADYYQSKGNRKMANLYRRKAQKVSGRDIRKAPESVRK